jgi:hypothetical protein
MREGSARPLDARADSRRRRALLSFYVSYLAYRNLKAVLPFLRPGELFDRELAEIDQGAVRRHDPAVLLHQCWASGCPPTSSPTVYAAFIVFLPLSLADRRWSSPPTCRRASSSPPRSR